MTLMCKKCRATKAVKNGIVAGRQRYRCKVCGCNFREGDKRTTNKIEAKKALCILLYAMAKASFRMMSHILRTDHTQIYRWIRAFGQSLPEPEVPGDIRQMEFDEMWHFIGSKKRSFGLSRPLTVAHGELWPGCQAVVMLQLSGGSTTKPAI
jgi:transposase